MMKAARMYRMDAVEVATLPSGEMDYDKFEQALRENADRPAIVNVNIGTTVKGAVDNLDTVIDVLRRVGFNEVGPGGAGWRRALAGHPRSRRARASAHRRALACPRTASTSTATGRSSA